MRQLTAEEQETIIRYDNKHNLADVYTWQKSLMKKLITLSKSRPEITILEKTEDYIRCVVPKSWIKVNPSRQISDAERKRRSELMKQIKNSK